MNAFVPIMNGKSFRIFLLTVKVMNIICMLYFSSIPMNHLHIAKASNQCQAFFMTILYTELWTLSNNETNVNHIKLDDKLKNPTFQQVATKVWNITNF